MHDVYVMLCLPYFTDTLQNLIAVLTFCKYMNTNYFDVVGSNLQYNGFVIVVIVIETVELSM